MNKVAIISGATKGLGRALVFAFAQRSYRIVGIYKSDMQAARELESACAEHGWFIKLLQADVTSGCDYLKDEQSIHSAEKLVLLNNAGPSFEPRPMHLFKWADYQAVLFQGLSGMVHCTSAVVPIMVRKKGSGTIINVASSSAIDPPKGFSPYAAAKSAMLSFTRSLGVEYANKGLRVFSVSPGFMLTDATSAWHPSLIQAIAEKQGGALEPLEVASHIAGLAEDASISACGEDYLISNTFAT